MNVSLLAPAALAAGVSLAVIYLLHIRRQTPPPRRMSSLRFWSAADASVTDRQRFQLPPLSLALLLQLLIAAIVTLALARPALSGSLASFGDTSQPEHTIILLDGSTSMQATADDGAETRWSAGREAALDIVDDWRAGDVVSVLVIGNAVVSRSASNSSQKDEIRDWLEDLPAPGGRADIDSAMETAANLNLPDRRNHIVFITDRAIYPAADIVRGVGMPIDIVTPAAASVSNNAAITSIGARQIAGSTRQFAVAFQVANFSTDDADIPWSARADGDEIATNTLFLGPGESRLVTVNLPVDTGEATMTLSFDDVLPADNVASIPIGGRDAGARRILLLSDAPSDLLRALQAIPGASVQVYPPATPGLTGLASGFDLLVSEGYVPAAADRPAMPTLFVQPAADPDGVIIDGAVADPTLSFIDAQAPEMSDVDLSGITWGTIPVYQIAENDVTIAAVTSGNQQTPLIWKGVQGEHPWIATAFAVPETNLAGRVAFPILVSRMVESLMQATVPRAITAGDAISIPTADDVATISVTRPDTSTTRIDASRGSETVFADTGAYGMYTIVSLRADGSQRSSIEVVAHAGDPVESDLASNADLDNVIALAGTAPEVAATRVTSPGEVWRLITIALLAMLLVEWYVSGRTGWRRQGRQRTA